MFGNLMGDMEERQKELRKKLAERTVEATAQNGAVTVVVNGNREVTNISIDSDKIELTDTEQLEDLLLVATNEAMEKAAIMEAEATQELLRDMMPPGLGGLGGLFG
jgi:DNA-binding YbaB/EbfC family protein